MTNSHTALSHIASGTPAEHRGHPCAQCAAYIALAKETLQAEARLAALMDDLRRYDKQFEIERTPRALQQLWAHLDRILETDDHG